MGLPFSKRLREPIRQGEITCTVRIWQDPKLKVGGRYAMEGGWVEVTAMRQIAHSDVTPSLARRSGFAGVVELLKVARHGPGEKVYLINFVFQPTDGYCANRA